MKRKDYYWAKAYWNEKFDFQKEFKTYQYLCGNLKKKREWNKIEKFKRYTDWKNYVQKKYEDNNELVLQEFIRYLNTKKQVGTSFKDGLSAIWIPILIILITETLKEYIEVFSILSQIFKSFWGILTMAFSVEQILGKMFAISITIGSFLFLMVIIFIIPVCLLIIVFLIDWKMGMASQERAFIEDYQEIIKEMIEERKMQKRIESRRD